MKLWIAFLIGATFGAILTMGIAVGLISTHQTHLGPCTTNSTIEE